MKILTQVRFTGSDIQQVRWGDNDDPVKAGLREGVLYDVTDIEVHSSHTKISINGVDGQFNSCSFEWLDPKVFDDAIANAVAKRRR